MTFERILSHFQVRKRGTGKAQCICPAHADREASLTLTDGNDRALIKQDIGKKRSVIQKNKDEVAGGPALVFKFLDCNYDEDGNVKSVKQLVHNFEVVMDKDSRFAGKIRLNEFAQQP